jgi:hypothetical protein
MFYSFEKKKNSLVVFVMTTEHHGKCSVMPFMTEAPYFFLLILTLSILPLDWSSHIVKNKMPVGLTNRDTR